VLNVKIFKWKINKQGAGIFFIKILRKLQLCKVEKLAVLSFEYFEKGLAIFLFLHILLIILIRPIFIQHACVIEVFEFKRFIVAYSLMWFPNSKNQPENCDLFF
jgi:hypothetical protein